MFQISCLLRMIHYFPSNGCSNTWFRSHSHTTLTPPFTYWISSHCTQSIQLTVMHLHFILISFKWRGHEQENWTRQIKLIRKRKMRTVEWSRVDSFLAFFCDISIAAININYAINCRTICLVIGSNQISIHLCDAYTLSIQLVLCSRSSLSRRYRKFCCWVKKKHLRLLEPNLLLDSRLFHDKKKNH